LFIKSAKSIIFLAGTGLDSQILGDFEIFSKSDPSFTQSKSLGSNNFMERLVNAVIQASKKLKRYRELVQAQLPYLLQLCTSRRMLLNRNKNILLWNRENRT
jgi:hypothetical protein